MNQFQAVYEELSGELDQYINADHIEHVAIAVCARLAHEGFFGDDPAAKCSDDLTAVIEVDATAAEASLRALTDSAKRGWRVSPETEEKP